MSEGGRDAVAVVLAVCVAITFLVVVGTAAWLLVTSDGELKVSSVILLSTIFGTLTGIIAGYMGGYSYHQRHHD